MTSDNTRNIEAQIKALQDEQKAVRNLTDALEALEAQKKAGKTLTEIQLRSIEELTRKRRVSRENVEKETKALEDLKKANDEYNASIDQTKGALSELTGINMQLLDSFKKNKDGVTDWKESALSASKTVMSAMLKFTGELDKQQVGLARTTGYATDLNDNMLALADANTGLYLSLGQSVEVIGGLSIGFRDFNALSEDSQRSTAELAGNFLNMGVQASSTAAGLDKLKKGMNFTQVAAEATMKSFKKLSVEIGSPLGQIVEDFNDLAPALARFGAAGPRVFRDLANQARSLGLTTRQAFDFTEMFDTFESSADVAGKLNAQLGLQLNSVEMMSASSEERLKILRAEFSMQGTHFNDMSRRQKQMVAEIMGTDVDVAARLFGDPMEMRKFQREKANDEKRMKSFITISQRWQSSMQQFFINIAPLIDVFREIMIGLSEAVNGFMAGGGGKFLSWAIGFSATVLIMFKALKFLGPVFSLVFAGIAVGINIVMDLIDAFSGKILGWAKLVGGILGALAGFVITGFNPLGAMAGYMAGSAIGGKLAEQSDSPKQMNDGQLPGGTLMSTPDGQQIQSRPDDAIFLGTGDIHRTLKQIADNTSMTREGQRFTVSAPIKLTLEADKFKQSIIDEVMIEFNPTK